MSQQGPEPESPSGEEGPCGRDAALLTGAARFTDDVQVPRSAYLALLGSRYPHAHVEVDSTEAAARDGVLAVYTADDITAAGQANVLSTFEHENGGTVERPLLAVDRVRYQGQPVVAIVAERRYDAFAALERVDIDYERLDAVARLEDARDDVAPTLHRAAPDNVAFTWDVGDEAATDQAFTAAERTVDLDLVNNRVVPMALEPRSAVARPVDGQLVVTTSAQRPHSLRERLAAVLGRPEASITVRVPNVGGGFGARLYPYAGQVLAAWSALRLNRPVTWQARRGDDFQAMVHGRHQQVAVEAALDAEGRIAAVRGRIQGNVGAYPISTGACKRTARLLCGQYDIPVGYVSVVGVFTNTAPIAAYRGAGRPEAAYAVERLVAACARETETDPVAFRRRNFVLPDAFPRDTPLGAKHDSGAYESTLDGALEYINYERFRARQADAREEGRYLGIGLSCYVNLNSLGAESTELGAVRVTPSGKILARAGTQDTGQGHGPTFARVVADELGVDVEGITVVEGDTDRVPKSDGTYGSRSVTLAGNALRAAARRLVERVRRRVATDLGVSASDLSFADGRLRGPGAGADGLSIREAIAAVTDTDLEATVEFSPDGQTSPFGTHIATVEVIPNTGDISVERYVAVDDVGVQVDPQRVEAQVTGGVVQGLGQALSEEGHYDDAGNLVTANLQNYAVPRAPDVPAVEWDSTVTPSPTNPLGVKGVGEVGTVAAPPAVVNAVLDALEPFGIDNLNMPLTSERVWRAVRDAE